MMNILAIAGLDDKSDSCFALEHEGFCNGEVLCGFILRAAGSSETQRNIVGEYLRHAIQGVASPML